MSHYHCEIVMPTVPDVESAISKIMAPFDENMEDSEDNPYSSKHSFWDWYVIGGRWSGDKLVAECPQEKIDEFYAWLKSEGVTVAGIQWGKQELSPATQVTKVDAKWQEMFPHYPPVPCPLFKHSNDQYNKDGKGLLPGDIMRLCDVTKVLKCDRVIVAGPGFVHTTGEWTGELAPVYMVCDELWNGVNHVKSAWDGLLISAVEASNARLAGYSPKKASACTTKDDWLVVTVDYHS